MNTTVPGHVGYFTFPGDRRYTLPPSILTWKGYRLYSYSAIYDTETDTTHVAYTIIEP